MATYPDEKFQGIYDSILASMGDDESLKANLEAALRPMYEQSVQQLQQQRIANNAAIDVDAASRGMGNSTWVTDAKLRQLRGESDQLASLNANYNNQLYSALLDAINDRDDKAYNQAMQWWQLNNKGGGSGKPGSPVITPISAPDITTDTAPVVTGYLQDTFNKGDKNRAIVNPWNYTLMRDAIKQYTK